MITSSGNVAEIVHIQSNPQNQSVLCGMHIAVKQKLAQILINENGIHLVFVKIAEFFIDTILLICVLLSTTTILFYSNYTGQPALAGIPS